MVVLVVDVRAMTVLRAIPRESYSGKLPILRNFRDSSDSGELKYKL